MTAYDVQKTVAEVTERIRERSKPTREPYLARLQDRARKGPNRTTLSCGNLAHGFAACGVWRQGGAERRRRAQSRHHHLL
jgi:phosphogluconate dehydratase